MSLEGIRPPKLFSTGLTAPGFVRLRGMDGADVAGEVRGAAEGVGTGGAGVG